MNDSPKIKILESLTEGINPPTGEWLEDNNFLNDPDVHQPYASQPRHLRTVNHALTCARVDVGFRAISSETCTATFSPLESFTAKTPMTATAAQLKYVSLDS